MKLPLSILVFLFFLGLAWGGVFRDDFEDGILNGWRVVSGEWQIIDGDLVLTTVPQDGTAAMLILESPWQIADATVTVNLAFEQGSEGTERPMIFFRLEDEFGGYALRFEGDRKWMGIGIIRAGSFESIRGDVTDAIDIKQITNIKVDIKGNLFFVYHNGVLRSRIGDTKVDFEKGFVGVGASAVGPPIHFKDIQVEGEGVWQHLEDLRPVVPQSKLVTVWARLK